MLLHASPFTHEHLRMLRAMHALGALSSHLTAEASQLLSLRMREPSAARWGARGGERGGRFGHDLEEVDEEEEGDEADADDEGGAGDGPTDADELDGGGGHTFRLVGGVLVPSALLSPLAAGGRAEPPGWGSMQEGRLLREAERVLSSAPRLGDLSGE